MKVVVVCPLKVDVVTELWCVDVGSSVDELPPWPAPPALSTKTLPPHPASAAIVIPKLRKAKCFMGPSSDPFDQCFGASGSTSSATFFERLCPCDEGELWGPPSDQGRRKGSATKTAKEMYS